MAKPDFPQCTLKGYILGKINKMGVDWEFWGERASRMVKKPQINYSNSKLVRTKCLNDKEKKKIVCLINLCWHPMAD